MSLFAVKYLAKGTPKIDLKIQNCPICCLNKSIYQKTATLVMDIIQTKIVKKEEWNNLCTLHIYKTSNCLEAIYFRCS